MKIELPAALNSEDDPEFRLYGFAVDAIRRVSPGAYEAFKIGMKCHRAFHPELENQRRLALDDICEESPLIARQAFRGFVLSDDRNERADALHLIPDSLAKLDHEFAVGLLDVLAQDEDADIAEAAGTYLEFLHEHRWPDSNS